MHMIRLISDAVKTSETSASVSEAQPEQVDLHDRRHWPACPFGRSIRSLEPRLEVARVIDSRDWATFATPSQRRRSSPAATPAMRRAPTSARPVPASPNNSHTYEASDLFHGPTTPRATNGCPLDTRQAHLEHSQRTSRPRSRDRDPARPAAFALSSHSDRRCRRPKQRLLATFRPAASVTPSMHYRPDQPGVRLGPHLMAQLGRRVRTPLLPTT
jgi:hypothetical protein